MSTIYRKTAKGHAEIETRALRLPPRLRGALIMVDGQRSVEDLAKLIPGDAVQTLEQLLADRLSTRVRLGLGRRKGRLEIEFADLEDLERIFRLIS